VEIKITKEIEKNYDIHITFYIDDRKQSEFYIGIGRDKEFMQDAIINMIEKTVKALLSDNES
jgi:hypothetical protein